MRGRWQPVPLLTFAQWLGEVLSITLPASRVTVPRLATSPPRARGRFPVMLLPLRRMTTPLLIEIPPPLLAASLSEKLLPACNVTVALKHDIPPPYPGPMVLPVIAVSISVSDPLAMSSGRRRARRPSRARFTRVRTRPVVGGALTTQAVICGEAKNKKGRSGSLANLKPISMWVDNTAGTGPVIVQHGEHYREGRRMCCRVLTTTLVMPGTTLRFAGNTTVGYLWINEYFKYTFSFHFHPPHSFLIHTLWFNERVPCQECP